MSENEAPRQIGPQQPSLTEMARESSRTWRELLSPDYRGPNRAIRGSIRKGDEFDTFYVHFTPRVIRIGPFHPGSIVGVRNPERRAEALRQLSEDLLDFIKVLRKDESFKRVQVVQGETNYTMARFAIEHLGFSVYHSPDDPRTEAQILEDARRWEKRPLALRLIHKGPHPTVTIQISKDDFLTHEEEIKKLGQA